MINRDAQNNPILRTPLGDLRVTSDVFLKTGSEVVFRVDAKVASLARILTVDGLTPEEYSTQNTSKVIKADTVSSTLPAVAPGTAQALIATPQARANAATLEAILLQLQPLAASAAPKASPGTLLHVKPPLYAQLAEIRVGTPIAMTLLDLKLPPLPIALSSIPSSTKLDALIAPLGTTAQPSAQNAAVPEVATTKIAPSQIAFPKPDTAAAPVAFTIPKPADTLPPSNAALPVSSTPLSAEKGLPLPAEVVVPSSITSPASVPTAIKSVVTNVAPSTVMIANEQLEAAKPDIPTVTKGLPISGTLSPEAASVSPGAGAHAFPHARVAAYATYPVEVRAPLASHSSAHPSHAQNVVEAQVIGHDADGGNILHTPMASFKVYTPQPLPTGTTLTVAIELSAAPNDRNAAGAAVVSEMVEKALQRDHTAALKPMQEAMQWLSTHHPDIAREVADRLPSPTVRLTHEILFFLNIIKGGALEDIFGRRATRAFEQAAPELLKRLRVEMGALSTLHHEPSPSGWLSLPIPLMVGQNLNTLTLFVHPDALKSQKDRQVEGQRFILEANLSELGVMQFDGFVRKNERRRSFDLIVRSVAPLDTQLSQAIHDVFHSSMEAVRMHGQVVFQAGGQHFFHPNTSAAADDGTQTILA